MTCTAVKPAFSYYAMVTLCYWGFTLTDGALRMLVLLHFHHLGYSPFTLAMLFLCYEAAGIFANLAGGWLAVRFGITRMLGCGLLLQIIGLLLLSRLDVAWPAALSVVWVLVAQGVSGIAKDITKTASKSAIRYSAGQMETAEQSEGGSHKRLFAWVAWFTGSKNAMKGIGFLLGGDLLAGVGFADGLISLAVMLVLLLVISQLILPRQFGIGPSSRTIGELLSKSAAINILAAARVFLFGARDIWFVVGVPVYLYSAGWSFLSVSLFIALWTIFYGAVQGIAPKLVRRGGGGLNDEITTARRWISALTLVPLLLGVLLSPASGPPEQIPGEWLLVGGLGLFGLIFAVISSLHSYLVLAFAGSRKAAEDVGFYYAANAAGRLLGTLLSGIVYQQAGGSGVLFGAAAMLGLCLVFTMALPRQQPA